MSSGLVLAAMFGVEAAAGSHQLGLGLCSIGCN